MEPEGRAERESFFIVFFAALSFVAFSMMASSYQPVRKASKRRPRSASAAARRPASSYAAVLQRYVTHWSAVRSVNREKIGRSG